MQYELTSLAREQIEAIVAYTDELFGIDQTEDYIHGIFSSFELLADNPKLGRVWKTGIRRYIYRSHAVFYQVIDGGELGDDSVLIATIRSAERNLLRQ